MCIRDMCIQEHPCVEVRDLGLMGYHEAWELQKSLFGRMVELRGQKLPLGQEWLLLVEHRPVYTLGVHGKYGNLLVSEEVLRARGAEVVRTERGGDITYHGPGQLVAYPIIDLQRRHLGIRDYVDGLEETVIRLLASYGLQGERVEGATGVWLGKGTSRERKICAIGVKCRRYVTMHGLALNVSTDLSAFSAINPCGFVDKGVTSLQLELGRDPGMDEVKGRFEQIFRDVLKG